MLPHGLFIPERSADRSRGLCTVGREGVTSTVGAGLIPKSLRVMEVGATGMVFETGLAPIAGLVLLVGIWAGWLLTKGSRLA